MSSKMSGNCPLVSKNVWKTSRKMIIFAVRNFFMSRFYPIFFGHEKFQTNFGQIKQTNSGHENFQINYWTNSRYGKIFEEILDGILKFFTKNAKLSKLTFKTFIDILRKNEEQAKILYIYDVNLNIG